MNVSYNLWLICTKKICIRHTHEQASIKVETLFLCSDDVYYRAYCLGCNRWVRVSDDWLALFIMRYIRDGPLWSGGALGQRIRVEFFFPGQPAVEFFFSWPTGSWVFFFPGQPAVEFFFSSGLLLLPEPPPQIINGSSLMSYITFTAGDLNISHNIATCMKASTGLIVYYVWGRLYTSINLNWGHIFSIVQCSRIRMYLNGTWNYAIFMLYFIFPPKFINKIQ